MEDSILRTTLGKTEEFGRGFREFDLQTQFHPDPALANGYALFALDSAGVPASRATDSLVHHLAVIQQEDGSWPWNLPRPPIQSSDVGATALAVQALANHPIPGRAAEFGDRVRRARDWLSKARVEFNEERVYQILGLAWAGGASPSTVRQLAEGLIRDQRPDGGWGQLPTLPSDAFATGQALYALTRGAGLPGTHPAVRRGTGFLVKSQLADGTWYAPRRAFPFQPPMESGFPHGADSWLSAAASSWAVIGLASSVDPSRAVSPQPALARLGAGAPAARSSRMPSGPGGEVEFSRDIRPVLERSCVACHSGERAKGGFQVVSREALLKGGKRGEPAVVPGKADVSPLLRCVSDQVEDLEMPPLGKRGKFPSLTPEEIGKLAGWINGGATWPQGVTLQLPAPR